MDTTVFTVAAQSAGVLPSAVEDAVRRLTTHFATQAEPTPDLITQQLTLLRTHAPHLFPAVQGLDAAGVPVGVPASVWQGLSPSTKLAWAREHMPLPVVERRHPPVVLSAAQVSALAAMPPAQRLAAYRALQESHQDGA